jgi:hypothetical protein
MDEKVRFNKAIYNLSSGSASGDISTVYLNTMHLFHHRKELKEYLTNHFKMNQITDKARLATILKNGFDTGFLSIEKKTLYYFKVRKDKELEFFKSLPFLSSMSPTERKQDKTRGIAYVLLLSKVIEKFDNTHSDQLYVTTKNDKEKYAVQLQPDNESLR